MPHFAFTSPLSLLAHPYRPSFCPNAPPRVTTFKSRGRAAISPQPTTGHRHSHTIVAFDEGLDDDIDEESIIKLQDNTGRTLSCGVEQFVQHSGDTFALCFPVDEVVFIARPKDDAFIPIEDDQLITNLFPNAEAVLSENNIVLHNTAFFLTIDDFDEGEDDDDDDDDDTDADENNEGVELIAQFRHENSEYVIARPLYPVLLLARVEENGFTVLRGDDLDRMTPIIDAAIERDSS